MEYNENNKENENEENSSSTNNSMNKKLNANRININDSPRSSLNLNYRSVELKIITNISNVFTEICDKNSKESNMEKNHRLIKPFLILNPPIKIKDYIEQLYSIGNMSGSTIILMLIYIDRFCNINKIKLSYQIIHKLILSSLIIAIKYNEDEMYSLKVYARFGGVKKAELEFLEICFITCINFNLFVKEELFNKYYDYFADENNDEYEDEEEDEKEERNEREEREEREERLEKEEIKEKNEMGKQKPKG